MLKYFGYKDAIVATGHAHLDVTRACDSLFSLEYKELATLLTTYIFNTLYVKFLLAVDYLFGNDALVCGNLLDEIK